MAEESQLLERALARLRQERNPTAALAALDDYARRFPAGLLGREERRVRVDALLVSGRLDEAGALLQLIELGATPRDRELRLIRAELQARRDCRAAISDYRVVLDQEGTGRLGERALWGRAACRTRLGDESGARSDLDEYLARFPSGPHADDARARTKK